jgi:hypothetical protein
MGILFKQDCERRLLPLSTINSAQTGMIPTLTSTTAQPVPRPELASKHNPMGSQVSIQIAGQTIKIGSNYLDRTCNLPTLSKL